MASKFKFRFHSKLLSAYFITSAIGFCILLLVIWNLTIKIERRANLERNTDFILNGIKTSILEVGELNSRNPGEQSQSLIQKHLDYTFEKSTPYKSGSRFVKASVYLLNPERQLISEWISPKKFAKECLTNKLEYFEPEKSNLLYLIDLTINRCAPPAAGIFEDHILSAPILVAFCIIFIWGVFIYVMLNSVSYAGRLLGSTENTADLIENTERIHWTDVGTLAQKALAVSGRNLQYYQTLVLDAQHDIAKVLDLINKKYDGKELNQNISILRDITQRLATEVRSYNGPNNDITAHRDISTNELLGLFQSYFSVAEIQESLPENLGVSISDIFVFERILVNLASNSIKHALRVQRVNLYFYKNNLCVRVFSLTSRFEALKLYLAKMTNRIDLRNSELPVYIKLFGRTGRGLSIVKRGVIQLGGTMIFSISNRVVKVGFNLPATLKEQESVKNENDFSKKRIIYFAKEDFKQAAAEHGLKDYLVSLDDLKKILLVEKKLEIVTDVELDILKDSIFKLITKKERIKGIALNWQGGSKI